jgi:NAD(P)H-hydrate epimerase
LFVWPAKVVGQFAAVWIAMISSMTYLTRAQVREIDRRAIEEFGVPGIVLMENAGRGAAEILMRLNPERRPVWIYCGKGNNGGDGFVIARHLDIQGYSVVVVACDDPAGLSGDAAVNCRVVKTSDILILPPSIPNLDTMFSFMKHNKAKLEAMEGSKPVWVVDAIFGTGLSGPIRGTLAMCVEKMKSDGTKVLAVDIPSGLDCDTGKPPGPCVRADHTVTFVAPKAGFANPEAREWLGEVHVVGIGAPRVLLEQYGVGST